MNYFDSVKENDNVKAFGQVDDGLVKTTESMHYKCTKKPEEIQ